MPIITVIIIGAMILAIIIFAVVLYKQDRMDNKQRGEAIGNIVKSVEKHAAKKEEHENTLRKMDIIKSMEDNNIAARKSIENIAKKMRETKDLSPEEENEFWVWVDSEVAKMTDEQRNELGKLLNK